MTGRNLTSDHVNYLVWRYLQEFGYGEAAVRLQRDWNLDPEALDFACHVKPQALVSLVQKGLLYHELEQSIDQARHSGTPAEIALQDISTDFATLQYGNPIVVQESSYFFGLGAARVDKAPEGLFEQRAEASGGQVRKHAREESSATNGLSLEDNANQSLNKKRRVANGGLEAMSDASMDREMAMDGQPNGRPTANGLQPNGHYAEHRLNVNGNGHGHGHPSPIPSPPPPATVSEDAAMAAVATAPRVTNGSSKAIQTDKVTELGRSETEFVDPGGAVLSCAWNPVHPTALAVTSDALCRIWHVARPNAKTVDMDPVLTSNITVAAWSHRGDFLAMGNTEGMVSLWKLNGSFKRNMVPTTRWPILCLRWNDNDTLLLGLAGEGPGGSSVILVWNVHTTTQIVHITLSPPTGPVLDASWTGREEFVTGGHNILRKWIVTENQQNGLPYPPIDDPVVRTAISDGRELLATVSGEDRGNVMIWDNTNRLLRNIPHSDYVPVIEWQPLPRSTQNTSSIRILATACLDNFIRLWNVRTPESAPLHKLEVLYINAISFSPDGSFLAAASLGEALVFDTEQGGFPKARWKLPSTKVKEEPGRHDAAGDVRAGQNAIPTDGEDMEMLDQPSPSETEVPDYSVAWDADGKKLAYGEGKKLAIVRFR